MSESSEESDIMAVQRWPVADIAPGDVVWCDEHGDWLEVERVEQAFKTAPIYLYGPEDVAGIDHEYTNVVLRRVHGFNEDHRLGNDGVGSYPANPAIDRPQSRWRRLVGPWERVS